MSETPDNPESPNPCGAIHIPAECIIQFEEPPILINPEALLNDVPLADWAKLVRELKAQVFDLRARIEQLESLTLGAGRLRNPCAASPGSSQLAGIDSFTISTNLMETRISRLQEQITQNHKRLQQLENKNLPPEVSVDYSQFADCPDPDPAERQQHGLIITDDPPKPDQPETEEGPELLVILRGNDDDWILSFESTIDGQANRVDLPLQKQTRKKAVHLAWNLALYLGVKARWGAKVNMDCK